jgi:hypothetical protein
VSQGPAAFPFFFFAWLAFGLLLNIASTGVTALSSVSSAHAAVAPLPRQ